jgi:hypothetical protein
MFRKHVRKIAGVLGVALALALLLPKLALADDDDDPPSVVARLAFAQGAVSFQPGGTDDWVDAVINRPVTIGDKLWSDNDGRVELQLDDSNIRLSNNTGISFLNLNDNITQIRLTEGTLLIRVRHLDENETYEVDTPNLAFSIYRPGVYRVNVNEGGDATAIVVRSGEGQVTGGGASYSLRANDDAVFSGVDELNADVEDYGGATDDFDAWSDGRDRHYGRSRSAQYVSQDVVGYEDLDDHGDWREERDYGHVWYPQVAVGWAPYHYGHWAYVAPWGYTWVDDQPWGFAPFHYGRWVNVEGRWGWIPTPPRAEGVVYVRPVYAPALVAFVGGGGFAVGVGVGGGGAVGWFPLGPREVYVPSYRVSPRYVENVNVSNTTVNRTVVNNYYNTTIVNNTTTNTRVTNVTYVNQRVPGAVMATSQQAFTSAQPVSRNVVKVDERQMATAQVTYRAPTVVPTKQAVLGTGQVAVRRPPAVLQTRAVVAKATPPPPPPTFEARQQAIKSNGGQPLSAQQVRQIQPAPAARAQVAAVRVAPPPKAPAVSVREAPKPAQPAVRPVQGNVAGRPGQPPAAQPQAPPANRPAPATPPAAVQPNRPAAATPPPSPNRPPTAVQPAPHPADRPVTQPATPAPANRPVTPPNATPPNATPPPTNRPADRPVTQPAPRPAEQPAAKPATPPPAVKPVNPAPAPRPAEQSAPKPQPTPAPKPVDRPEDRPAARPAPTPAERQQQEKQQQKDEKGKEKQKEKDKEKDKP